MEKTIIKRPPVVVVVGHIDHGKSTLLEAIRKDLAITKKESGGITQHIGAYEVSFEGKKITFIDTPGHEAFSAMRSRGAKVADIAVLVVDACEGVKSQTKEAISSVKKAGIPMIVALNKIDKPVAQPEKVKQELAANGVLVESQGGKIPSQNVSAKTGQGVKELLDVISIVSEMENLSADMSEPAQGTIIESYLDSKRGPVATVILKTGILKKGQIVGTSSAIGKVKSLEDFQGNVIESAFPSQPVVVLGFEKVPHIGENIQAFSSLEYALKMVSRNRDKRIEYSSPIIISDNSTERKIVNVIIKTDVLGSLEAIEESLEAIPQEKVFLRILKSGVGDIQPSDVELAFAAKAKIFGFRVKISPSAKNLIRQRKLGEPKIFQVIYDFVQGVREIMERAIKPKITRIELGKVKILAIFRTEKGKKRQIIGGEVIDGEVQTGASCEILREEEKIGEGRILNLQHKKKNVSNVSKGKECGILFSSETVVKEGDIISVYKTEKEVEKL
ncbi:translation initiation factor IF-2 [bacterium]|nr:translation initiation factor IF-2 [bacterium]